jgi:hypothetical protein
VWLEGAETHLAFLLRAWFADPCDAAPNGAQFVAGDDLHELSTPEPKTAAKPEPFGRTIDNQARNPLRDRTEVDDQAGSLPRGNPFRAASFVRGEGGHSFVLDGDFPQDPPLLNKSHEAKPSGEYRIVRAE